jgi:hypothetical protein
MATIPSIKGSVFAGHAEILKKFIDTHPLDSATLESRFEPGDLELLSRSIPAASWYDIRIYTRIMEFLRDYEGNGSNQYLINSGMRSAESLIRSGMYQQFEYLQRTQLNAQSNERDRFVAFGRDLRLLMTVNQSILNFSPNELLEDPDHELRHIIQHIDAEHYPEVLCWTTQGFCNRMAAEHGNPDLWFWERPSRDLVWFRMNRSL